MKSTMRMSDHNLYISHAWGGESEQIVQEIYKRCQKAGLNIIMDRQDLGYRESISSFMKNLGRADAIILVVSNKYLHSEYCMFELLQIYEHKNMINRIFPVVLDEVSIAKSTERLDLVKYWESETDHLEAKIRELKNLSYIEGITDDLNLYQKIRNNIAQLTKILKDINTLNIRLHKDNDYNHLIQAIETYILQSGGPETGVAIPTDNQGVKSNLSGNKQDRGSDSGIFGAESNLSEKPSSVSKSESRKKNDSSGPWWSKILRVLPYFVMAGAVFVGLYLWLASENPEEDSVFNRASEQMVANENTNSGQIVELSPLFPDRQDSKKGSVSESNEVTLKTEKANNSSNSGYEEHIATTRLPETKVKDRAVQDIKYKPPNVAGRMAEEDSLSRTANRELEIGDRPMSSKEIEEAEPNFRTEKIYVPATSLSVSIPIDISSNKVVENDIVYLMAQEPILSDGQIITGENARVRTRIIDAKASYHGGRGALGIRLEAIETLDGQWLKLNYHDIVERRRKEVVFNSGTVLDDVKIESATINFKIFQ